MRYKLSSRTHNRKKLRRKNQKPKVRLMRVKDWIVYWYTTYKEPKHAETTRQVQWVYINHHIVPHFGDMFLHQVTTDDVQKFINLLSKSGNKTKLRHSKKNGEKLASWTVKKIRALLKAAFDAAIRENLIPKNPVQDTEPIPVQTLSITYFTPEQQAKFLLGTQNHRFYFAYQLLFNTGCRRSEILGLTWECVDFNQEQILIRNVLVNINGNPTLKEYPKTKNSVRTIPLHSDLIKMLKFLKKRQLQEQKETDGWNNEHNLVFVNKDGTPHSPTYFLHNFKQAIKKLGLPKNLRVHSTRHTFATNLLQLGTPISDVQALGGWADTRVVLDIYAHSAPDSHRKALKKLFERKP